MVGWAYRIIFWVGLLCLVWGRENFTFSTLLVGLPIAALLAGSYFWIRLDIWRDDETIKKMCRSEDGFNDTVKADLVARSFDSRAAFVLIVIAAFTQAISLWPTGTLIFVGVLFILISVVHWINVLVDRFFPRNILNNK